MSHTGEMFTELSKNGFRQCGWHSPVGIFFPAPSFLHDVVAELLFRKNYGTAANNASEELLSRGWVRATCDGYYEVARFEGCARTTLLDLVAVLPPEMNIAVDVVGPGKHVMKTIDGYTAEQFYDKYL